MPKTSPRENDLAPRREQPGAAVQVPDQPSAFERFVSEHVELTESQFEVLRKYEGITFSLTYPLVPEGKIVVPVRIVRPPGMVPEKMDQATDFRIESKAKDIEAGYLLGPADVISGVFRLLGVKSRYAISTELKQFGYDLFRLAPETFAPSDMVPVGPNYVLGPGDEIRVSVWGKVEGQFLLVVDRDGNISIPKVGTIGVAGLTFRELKEAVFREFSKYYTGFEMNVSMGSLRTMNVYVVGAARQPGAYTISSLSTLVNALFAAGGPGKAGTMRDIQVKRNGDTVVHFDLYDLLLKGDKTNDIRLMPEDVIFIPPVGPIAAVAGSVNSPGLYELRGKTSVTGLIEMAGGLNPLAFQGRIQVERIMDGSRQVVFESDWEKAKEQEIPARSGDVIKVYPVVPDKRLVRVSGAVQREGEYGYSAGMTVKDLVSLTGGLKYYAYRQEAELTRVMVTEEGPQTEKITIPLEKALEGDPASNIPLRENDYLFVRTVPEWKVYQIVNITGEVKYPGAYTIQKGEKLSSLIERAGGFTDRAYRKGAVFTREKVRELQQRQVDEMVDRLERELAGRSSAGVSTAINPEEARILEIGIQQMNIFLEKLRTAKAKGRMVVVVTDPAYLKKTPYDIELEEGDNLFIPENPQTVQVTGSVFNQTAFVYREGRSLHHYVDLAGGYTENADDERIYVLKVDGTAIRPKGGIFSGLSWDADSKRWGSADYRTLDPGDTIVVPEKLERIAWLREIKDITQILFQVAVSAGVIIAAF
jgi:protein involved in polysaccharide export with SLBB domain